MSGCFDSEPKNKCACMCHIHFKEVCESCSNGNCYTVKQETLSLCPHGYAPSIIHPCLNCIVDRLDKLESHINKLHDMINLEDRITACDVLNRLTLIEDKLEKVISKDTKKPYVCPRCNDLTDCDMCANTGLVWG